MFIIQSYATHAGKSTAELYFSRQILLVTIAIFCIIIFILLISELLNLQFKLNNIIMSIKNINCNIKCLVKSINMYFYLATKL